MSRPEWAEIWTDMASLISKRSACSVRQVGAVIVSRDNTVHWAGYNGPPAGYPERLGLSKVDGCTSYCPQGQDVFYGREAIPGLAEIGQHCVSIHAEINALMKIDRDASLGGTIYVTAAPCWKCALAIANSGLAMLVCPRWETERDQLGHDVSDMYSHLKLEIVYT